MCLPGFAGVPATLAGLHSQSTARAGRCGLSAPEGALALSSMAGASSSVLFVVNLLAQPALIAVCGEHGEDKRGGRGVASPNGCEVRG